MHTGRGAQSKFKTDTAPVVQREFVIRHTVKHCSYYYYYNLLSLT